MNKPRSTASGPRLKLYGRIHCLMSELGISDETYRDILHVNFNGVSSKADLTDRQLLKLIDHLEALHPGGQPPRNKSYPKRPRNMDKGDSRAVQLGKIEALLTVGGKPWAYADAIARNVCKIDKVEWVPDDKLYKIITALRLQAKRQGWDLSGEKQ